MQPLKSTYRLLKCFNGTKYKNFAALLCLYVNNGRRRRAVASSPLHCTIVVSKACNAGNDFNVF